MIRIHLGVADAPDAADTLTLSQPEDYIGARLRIRDALRSGLPLEVFVLTRVCDGWFWDLEGDAEVQLLQEDPVTLLRRKLRVLALPPEVADPDLVISLALLDLPDPPEPVSDVVAWIVGHKLGEVWSVSHSSYEHATQLVAWWATRAVPTLLQPFAQRRLQIWIEQASGPLREVYRAMQQDPERSALALCCWQALKVYGDEIRRQWLQEEGWYLPHLVWLAERLGALPVPLKATKLLSLKAEAYWRRRLEELDKEVVLS